MPEGYFKIILCDSNLELKNWFKIEAIELSKALDEAKPF